MTLQLILLAQTLVNVQQPHPAQIFGHGGTRIAHAQLERCTSFTSTTRLFGLEPIWIRDTQGRVVLIEYGVMVDATTAQFFTCGVQGGISSIWVKP